LNTLTKKRTGQNSITVHALARCRWSIMLSVGFKGGPAPSPSTPPPAPDADEGRGGADADEKEGEEEEEG
jgi:hypothetical protein